MASNWQKLFFVGLGAINSAFCLPAFAQNPAGPIGPQGLDTNVIEGINTAGTVRVNMLANFESLVNITANGAEVIGIIWASILLVSVYRCMTKNARQDKKRLAFGISIFALALAIPGLVNWLLASARDANLFS